jgi:SAM-dependent methyltransferase
MTRLTDDLFICNRCGLISSEVEVDPSIYDKSYVMKYQRYEKTNTGVAIQELRRLLVSGHVGSGRVLDYGCGVGSFVKEARKYGFDVAGYDINPHGEYCDPIVLLDDYDIVTFWDSIEHIQDPAELIQRLDAEWVFVCTPSTDDFGGKMTDWRHYMPEEHCHYFNEKSLTAMLDACGYDVVEANYSESVLRTGGGGKNIISIGGRKRA